MKLIHKILLSSAFYLGIFGDALAAPAGMRAAVKPSLIKSTVSLLKQPNLVMAGLGVASLAYAKYCAIKADNPEVAGDMDKYEKRGGYAFMVGAGLLGLSANSFVLSQLKKRNYLPKLTNRSACIAATGATLGALGVDGGLSLMNNHTYPSEFGKKCMPHAPKIILGGWQLLTLAFMYLGMA